ncbi:MAG: hypothetical protein LBT32_02600 [Peptococcaceae bacterium]|jgi:hypothetical protein|nr:hypothetical protein [Peptococcaceae bacterium]
MSVFEAMMLLCFGAAWPFSIYKSYTTGSSAGKSVVFMSVIIVGYAAGILHKIFFYFDWVIFLYLLNMVMVSIDLALYFRNQRNAAVKKIA